MKKFSKNKILATLLLSVFVANIESINSEAFSKRFVSNKSLNYSQRSEVKEICKSSALRKYIEINENITGTYRAIILLTLAGVRKENNEQWKTILRALKKTEKILEIRFSRGFKRPQIQQAVSMYSPKSGKVEISLNKDYFAYNSYNVNELQEVLCHELGHLYIEAVLINAGIESTWTFKDRYLDELMPYLTKNDSIEKFCKEYKLRKKEFEGNKLNSYSSGTQINTTNYFTSYGLRAHDDSEMIADSMKFFLLNNNSSPIICALAALTSQSESKIQR